MTAVNLINQHTRKVAVQEHVDGRKSFLRRVYKTILSVSAIKSKKKIQSFGFPWNIKKGAFQLRTPYRLSSERAITF